MTPKLARSYLFAPGSSDRLLAKVFNAGADAVVLDLEDAVAPKEKDRARQAVRQAVEGQAGEAGPAVWVRINDLGGEHWRSDVAAVVVAGLTGLRVPKVESLASLETLEAELARAEKGAGLEAGRVALALTVESAVGALAAPRLATASRVAHLVFGAADFAADIGADPDEPLATLWARSRLVAAAVAAGIAPPIAPVYTNLDDPDGLRRSTLEARCLGFFGRSCIHPEQLPVVHEVFTPTAEEVAEATAVLRSLEAAATRGDGATKTSGRFIDEAVARRARRLLELAAALQPEVTRG